MAFSRNELDHFAAKERDRFEDMLKDFVEVPSVSADPVHKPDVERCAELGAATLRALGGRAELYRAPGGNPVVLGTFDAGPGRPTITVYNHLDVQPASKETEPWRTEPFRFTKQGDTLLRPRHDRRQGSGAHGAARRARRDGGGRSREHPVPVGDRGGDRLAELRGDAEGDRPGREDRRGRRVRHGLGLARAAVAARQGCAACSASRFHLETAETDQHSGTTGGAARNPVAELAQLASEIFDAKTGRVKIPGFYDDVEKLTASQIKDFKAAGFSVKGFIEDHGFKSIRTKDPLEVMKRIWAMPTFEVHGLVGGYSGPGVKTIVPPRAELKCSVRLVPSMKGEKIVKLIKAFVKKRHPDVRVEAGSSAPAYKGITSGPYVEAAKRSIQFAFGKAPVFVREGGTIGAVLSMEQILKCPIVFMGLSLPHHGYHAPNENYDWGQAGGGIVAFAKFFEEVSGL